MGKQSKAQKAYESAKAAAVAACTASTEATRRLDKSRESSCGVTDQYLALAALEAQIARHEAEQNLAETACWYANELDPVGGFDRAGIAEDIEKKLTGIEEAEALLAARKAELISVLQAASTKRAELAKARKEAELPEPVAFGFVPERVEFTRSGMLPVLAKLRCGPTIPVGNDRRLAMLRREADDCRVAIARALEAQEKALEWERTHTSGVETVTHPEIARHNADAIAERTRLLAEYARRVGAGVLPAIDATTRVQVDLSHDTSRGL